MSPLRPVPYALALIATLAAPIRVCVASPRPADATVSDSEGRAEELLKQALALADKGNLPDAREKLRDAFTLKQTFDIAANLGFIEVELGAFKDAATHLEFARRVFPPTSDPKGLDNIKQYLERAKPHVGGFQLETTADAEVFLDDAKVGTAPLSTTVFVEPGPHELRVEKPGFTAVRDKFEARAGEIVAKQIALTPEQGKTTPPPGESRPMWPAIVLGSVGAVGLGLGIGGVVAGLGATGDVEGLSCPNSVCPQSLIDATDQRNLLVGLGAAGFAIGGAALIGMTVYLVLPESAGSTEASVRLTPIVDPRAPGLLMSGSF